MVKVIGNIENITFEEKIPEQEDGPAMHIHASDAAASIAVDLDDGLAEKLEWAAGGVRRYG